LSTTKLFTAARRSAIGAVAILGATGALAVGVAQAANAATPQAAKTVNVTITQKANYTATYCVGDNLESRCVDNVRVGQSRTFATHPGKGEPVTISVIANGGGSSFDQIVPSGASLRLDAVGSKARPAVKRK